VNAEHPVCAGSSAAPPTKPISLKAVSFTFLWTSPVSATDCTWRYMTCLRYRPRRMPRESLTQEPTLTIDLWAGLAPGQKLTEPVPHESLSGHHAIVDEENDRVYMGYLSGGDVVSWDITDRTPAGPNYEYPIKWHIDLNPPREKKRIP